MKLSYLKFLLSFPFLFALGGCFSSPVGTTYERMKPQYGTLIFQADKLGVQAERNPARFEQYLDGELVTTYGVVREINKNSVEISTYYLPQYSLYGLDVPVSSVTCKIRSGYRDSLLQLNPRDRVIASGILDFSAGSIFENIYLEKCLIGNANKDNMTYVRSTYTYWKYSGAPLALKDFWSSPGPMRYLQKEMKVKKGSKEWTDFYNSQIPKFSKGALTKETYKFWKVFCNGGEDYVCNQFN